MPKLLFWKFRWSIDQQYKAMQDEAPDIVHLNSSVLITCALAARRASARIVWHVRETLARRPWHVATALYAALVRRLADQIICIGQNEQRCLGAVGNSKSCVVYNPIDLKSLDEVVYDSGEEKRKLGFREVDFVALSLGGVSVRKGPFELADALRYLPSEVKVLIAGPPMQASRASTRGRWQRRVEDALVTMRLKCDYSSYLQERVAQTVSAVGSKRVQFPGNVENVAPLLAACDVLVFAGTVSHFPRPVYEAWAMKKPVVVFDVEGIATQVEDGVDGIVVRKRTSRALACALERLMNNPDERTSLGAAGYVKAVRRCRPEKSAADVYAVYLDIMGKSHHSNLSARGS